MKYIIMAGGNYLFWDKPRHLTEVKGEPIIARTIRLLRENGVKDIAISSNNPVFVRFGVPILQHHNHYDTEGYNQNKGHWCNCFYPTDEPTCYIFGDVIFSPQAIKTIVETETDDIMLFGSKPPFAKEYPKKWIEPFAFKAQNVQHLRNACLEVKELDALGVFKRQPIAWELWSVICGSDPNRVNKSYVAINDYTCDIDYPEEAKQVEQWLV